MPEDQTISHLLKGMVEDLYQVLINSESTVDKFVTCCREVDAMRKKRVVPRYDMRCYVMLHPYQRQNYEDLSDLIRRIVKEEIEKVLPRIASCINDGPSDLESIIREVQINLSHSLEKNLHLLLTELKGLAKVPGDPRPRPRKEKKSTQQDTKTGL
ncbi:uncharacterized protein TNCV_1149641 [Trichonephila clavipes]|nr:uncharacterized protein TNCV_1149641 [Trichonephila clavipes]